MRKLASIQLIEEIKSFLKESNAIEQVYDEISLERAMVAWEYLISESEINTDVILKTHRLLTLHLLPTNESGAFRKCPVYIGGKEAIDYNDITNAINEWCDIVNLSIKISKRVEILNGVSESDHILFEKIHPFVDGNGRVGRMLWNWERIKVGLPIKIIHADWPNRDGEQYNYYKLFKHD